MVHPFNFLSRQENRDDGLEDPNTHPRRHDDPPTPLLYNTRYSFLPRGWFFQTDWLAQFETLPLSL